MNTQIEYKTDEKIRRGEFDVMFRIECFEKDDCYDKKEDGVGSIFSFVEDIEEHRLFKLVSKYLKEDKFMSETYEGGYYIGENHFIISLNCKEDDFKNWVSSYEFRRNVEDEVYYVTYRLIRGERVHYPWDFHHRLIGSVDLIEMGQLKTKYNVH
jgi:hypothetical protein